MAKMNGLDIFFEEGRTTIVIENPSEELNEGLKKKFLENTFSITSLLEPPEKKPEVEKDLQNQQNLQNQQDQQKEEPQKETEEEEVQNEDIIDAKELFYDSKKQLEIGIDKTILIFAEELKQDIESVKNWLDNSDMEKKKQCFVQLREKLKKIYEK